MTNAELLAGLIAFLPPAVLAVASSRLLGTARQVDSDRAEALATQAQALSLTALKDKIIRNADHRDAATFAYVLTGPVAYIAVLAFLFGGPSEIAVMSVLALFVPLAAHRVRCDTAEAFIRYDLAVAQAHLDAIFGDPTREPHYPTAEIIEFRRPAKVA